MIYPRDVAAIELLAVNTVICTEKLDEMRSFVWRKYMCGNEETHINRYDHKKPKTMKVPKIALLGIVEGLIRVQLTYHWGIKETRVQEIVCGGSFIIHELT